jgi:hypothetical protein
MARDVIALQHFDAKIRLNRLGLIIIIEHLNLGAKSEHYQPQNNRSGGDFVISPTPESQKNTFSLPKSPISYQFSPNFHSQIMLIVQCLS